MKELVGKVVKEMYVNEDQSLLKFVTDSGEVVYITEADCCSETWFADIIFGHTFFGKVVSEVTELEVPDWVSVLLTKDGRTRQEYDQVYGYQIVCANTSDYRFGSNSSNCDIIFRNSSNGYYGGSCELVDETSTYQKKHIQESVWTQITEDWQA